MITTEEINSEIMKCGGLDNFLQSYLNTSLEEIREEVGNKPFPHLPKL